MDLENRITPDARKSPNPHRYLRAGRIPLPVRRSHAVLDVLKLALCLTLATCIGQVFWIRSLRAGLHRIPNDPFDSLFGSEITRTSPEIWDDRRQDFIHNAIPVPVHSHNDYERRIPLFEALASGCVSIEADIHLVKGDLLVGHSSRGLRKDASLRSMYLEPLQRMIESQNTDSIVRDGEWRGIFTQDPEQTVVLLVDHKSTGADTFADLHAQLQPLRDLDYLTYWNGTEKILRPLTIVATGNAPFPSIAVLPEHHRDIFWDAHLEMLPSDLDDFTADPLTYKYSRSNSHYASTQFRNAVLWSRYNETHPLMSTTQGQDMAATQAEQAAARGLLVRYWDMPASPPNLEYIVWRVLVDAKVGVINMDDMGIVRDRAPGWGNLRAV